MFRTVLLAALVPLSLGYDADAISGTDIQSDGETAVAQSDSATFVSADDASADDVADV